MREKKGVFFTIINRWKLPHFNQFETDSSYFNEYTLREQKMPEKFRQGTRLARKFAGPLKKIHKKTRNRDDYLAFVEWARINATVSNFPVRCL
jgi:hypothetical protein